MAYIGNKPPVASNLISDVKIGEDDETKIDFADANTINFHANNSKEMVLVENALTPGTSDGIALGTTSLMWSDLFLASGAVINLNNGDVTLTHSANTLTVAGGTLATAALTTSTIVASGIIKTDDGTDATSTTDGSLQTDGGLSVAKDAVLGNDVLLLSDSAVLSLGADSDATLTHDGTTGLTIAANPFEVDSGGNITLDAHTGIFIFQDANTEVLRITESGSGDVTIKLETNAKDLIFTDNGDAEGFRILDAAAGVKVAGTLDLGHASDTTLARSASGEVTIEGVAVKKVGTENMWVPATAMTPRDNAGCGALTTTAAATNGRADITHLPFDASTQEHAQFSVAMPKSWNEGTIKAQFYWTTTGSDTDAVIWGISGVSYANDNPMDVAFGTAVTVTDNILSAAKDILVSAETGDVTIAGSPAAGEICYFEVFRDADDGSDTVGEDCLLIGVKIIYTTDTSTDA